MKVICMRKYILIAVLLASLFLFIILGKNDLCWVYAKEGIKRKYDISNDMTKEELNNYLIKYEICDNYQSTLRSEIERKLKNYFPNIQKWGWRIIGKEETDYLAELISYDDEKMKENEYKAYFLIKPDFSIELLEDTVEIHPEAGFCIYPSGLDYVYCGCRIAEYCAEYNYQKRNIKLNAAIPLFSLEESEDWNDINCNIWTGLEEWINNDVNYNNGEISLGYEIMTLDNDLYSILFQGKYESDKETEDVAVGLTISMSSGKLLSKSVFCTKEERNDFYNYYIEDGNLFAIGNEKGNIQSVKEGEIDFLSYKLEKSERNVYSSDGRWIGQCYYELPCIETYSDETEYVNQQIKKDMGSFFNELAPKFEDIVLLYDEESESGMKKLIDEPGYHCYVDTEIIYSSKYKFGVAYHYTFFLGEIHEEGEAVVVYDLKEKKVINYEDWQGEIIKKIGNPGN